MTETPAAGDGVITTDIVIVGGGPVGMSLALGLRESGKRVLIVDRAPRGAWRADPRVLAIAYGSRQIIERIGAWKPDIGTEIREIHVSQRGGFGCTLISADDYAVPALGYVLRYGDLMAMLDAKLAEHMTLAQGEVTAIATSEQAATVSARIDGVPRTIRAELVVHAEGTPGGGTGEDAVRFRDYRQQAIITEVDAVKPHRHRAWERFTSDGPVALLPHEKGYALVFTSPPERAAALLALDDLSFVAVLREQFGSRLDFGSIGRRMSIPLGLRVRATTARRRECWVGNTAQTLHPVSGQGLNLGLRDAFDLARVLQQGAASGRVDAGDPALLAAYTRSRRIDRGLAIGLTDGLVRVFSNSLPPLRFARGIGLLALDLFPPLRHTVAKRMLFGARAWP